MTADENIVYQVVLESGKNGIKSGDVGKKCKRATTEATKLLNNLEALDLIVSRKADGKSVKLWFDKKLIDNEVKQSHSTFKLPNGSFQENLIQKLCLHIVEFIQSQPTKTATTQSITEQLKAHSQHIERNDINAIIDILIFDSIILRTNERDLYRLNERGNVSQFGGIPCLKCTVIKQCRTGGMISPETCIYFQDW